MNPERIDSAVAIYKNLRDKYGRTPWGQEAAKVLNTRLKSSDSDLERLRKRVKESIEHFRDLFVKLAQCMVTHNSQSDVTVGQLKAKVSDQKNFFRMVKGIFTWKK